MFEDGHIEVQLNRNIYEYGAWVGVHMLMEKNIIPADAWYLFVHDTCRFGPNSQVLTEQILQKFNHTKTDCIWLCRKGFRNLCLLRRAAISEGYKLYANVVTMTKDEAIKGEMQHSHHFSPKSMNIHHHFMHFHLYVKEKRKVYGTHIRNVEKFDSIDLEKYVFHVQKGIIHPHNP